jgi:hypothetical protein
MTDADSAMPIDPVRYREMARDIRALVFRLKHSAAIEDLLLLAARYERLADFLEAAPGSTPEHE